VQARTNRETNIQLICVPLIFFDLPQWAQSELKPVPSIEHAPSGFPIVLFRHSPRTDTATTTLPAKGEPLAHKLCTANS
jgi:hypothetical protein